MNAVDDCKGEGEMSGSKVYWYGNTDNKEVHDLDNEDIDKNGCQIDEIIDAGHDTPFDDFDSAIAEGYDRCAKCLGKSTR